MGKILVNDIQFTKFTKVLTLTKFVLYSNSKHSVKSNDQPHNKKALIKVHKDKHWFYIYMGILHTVVMFSDQFLYICNIHTLAQKSVLIYAYGIKVVSYD